ncbi:MAG: hypothetical protein ACI8W8_000728 [Rhodothermales bacterium]|jgi:hypothetical protein
MADVPAICAGCECTFNSPEEMIGERMACPACGVMMQIQAPSKSIKKEVKKAEKKAADKAPKEENATLKKLGRGFRRLLRGIFKLAILAGLVYGGWLGYKRGSLMWLRPQAETAFYDGASDATMKFAKAAKNGDDDDRIRSKSLFTLRSVPEEPLGCFQVKEGRTSSKLERVSRVRIFVVDSVWGIADAKPRSPTTCWVRFVMGNNGKEPITVRHSNFVIQDKDGGGRFASIRGVAEHAAVPLVLEPGQVFWGGLMFEPVKTTPKDLLFIDGDTFVRVPINDCTPSGDFEEEGRGLPGIKALEYFPIDKAFSELMFTGGRAKAAMGKWRFPAERAEDAPRVKPAPNYKAF